MQLELGGQYPIGHQDELAEETAVFLSSIPYTARRKENETENEQSYGRLDCCIETQKYVYIFEFKLDGSAVAALKQVEDMGYANEFLASGKPIYKIGVNISSDNLIKKAKNRWDFWLFNI